VFSVYLSIESAHRKDDNSHEHNYSMNTFTHIPSYLACLINNSTNSFAQIPLYLQHVLEMAEAWSKMGEPEDALNKFQMICRLARAFSWRAAMTWS